MAAIATTRDLPQDPPGKLGPSAPSTSEIERIQHEHNLVRLAPLLGLAIALGTLFTKVEVGDWACAMIILAAALLPVHVWAMRYVVGMPIWPVVAFLCFLVYGVPFLANHPFTAEYSLEEKLTAAATVAGVLMIVTTVWATLGATKGLHVRKGRVIPKGRGIRLFIGCIALACVFQVNSALWFVAIPSELFGVLRAIIFSLCTMGLFSLSYELGSGQLTKSQKYLFICVLVIYIMATMLTLYLYVAMQIALVSLFGFFLGGGKPPWKTMVMIAVLFSVLQAGKSSLRANYWGDEGDGLTSITRSVDFFQEWFTEGVHTIFFDADPRSDSLLERGSVTQLVLKTQTETPGTVPFLNGSSYIVIPQLLIPRFIWPERPDTQEPLRELSVHYGLLAMQETETTQIGWGLIAEAFANFGYTGCIGLGLAMGLALGFVQRWCGRFPIRSARGLLGLLVVSCMVNVEANASTLLAAFVQSTVALILLGWYAMEEREIAG
jgi:hypothetical protein